MEVYLPIVEVQINIILILFVCFIIGFLSGLFGVGGGFLMTPFLIFMGIPPAFAVANEANNILASSTSGTLTHWFKKTMDLKIGWFIIGGGSVGTILGIITFSYFKEMGKIDLIITLAYMYVLAILGSFMLRDGILEIDRIKKKVIIKNVGIQNIYYLPIPITQHKRGIYKIELRYLEEKQTTSFHYEFKTKNYWTDEIDEVVGVMRYVLPYSEYKQLKGKDDSEKWEAVNTYWKEKDPSPETPENELLIELNERVRFSNKNFSILMHGWRSDRGRIYIIYGEPHIVDESYQDRMGYHYQKWIYSNGKEFIFIDRTMSGDYTLYQERF